MTESSDPLLDTECEPSNRRFSARWLKRRLALITVFFGTTLLLFWYFGAFGPGRPYTQPPTPNRPDASLVVTLPGYGSFQGTTIVQNLKKTTTLQSPVDAWLGVEYSTQPVGKDRFKPVSAPEAFEGTRDASSSGSACWQNAHSSNPQSEACLTINVYRPSGVPMHRKLPMLVFLHGGAFVMGSHGSFDGALFVGKSAQPLMVVTAQYRLGVLGTLPSKFMAEEGLLNLGLRDQKLMLGFMQRYAEHFGGDSDKITLGGQSAGGHAVGIDLFHNYNEDEGKPLFHQAILASGSPTARAFPGVDYALYQGQVKQFMDYVNCPATPSSAALDCLRSAKVNDIQFMSTSLYNAHNYNITWPWQPVSPGPLLEKRGSQSGKYGTFFKIPILISSTTDEGKGFVPQDLHNNAQFRSFWRTLTPGLTEEDLAALDRLYPSPSSNDAQSSAFVSSQFERLSAAYGDYSYTCPVQDTAWRLAAAGARVFKARFNTPNYAPAYMGVPHASDGAYFNGQPGAQYPEIAETYAAYWASFIVSGDPNTYRREGSVHWDTYDVVDAKTHAQLVVNRPSEGGPVMEDERGATRMQQCEWWRDDERAVRLNK
jgi:acetylcholinesterase